jgi:hypothetical protein
VRSPGLGEVADAYDGATGGRGTGGRLAASTFAARTGLQRTTVPFAPAVWRQGFASLAATAATVATATKPLVHGGAAAERQVFYWLAGCTGWVFSMVVLGGVTRLTRSGLAMTDWRFAGGLPPMTPDEWEVEFNKYKASPEYRTVNQGMVSFPPPRDPNRSAATPHQRPVQRRNPCSA